jgi:hypothetical protein
MSKQKKAESHTGARKSESSNKAFAVIIILLLLGIMPLLVWATIPETSTYTSVTTASPMVVTAAESAGLKLCSSNGVPVKVSGAQSAILSQLSPDCNAPAPSTTVQVLTVGFTSTEAQNAALATAMDTYKNAVPANTAVYTSGYNVFVVQGAPNNPAVQQVGDSLVEQGAVQVI